MVSLRALVLAAAAGKGLATETCNTADEATLLQGTMVSVSRHTSAEKETTDDEAGSECRPRIRYRDCLGMYEAEDARLTGAVVHANTASANHQGFTGDSFVDYLNPTGDSVEWRFNRCRPHSGQAVFRYALARGSRPMRLLVNGEEVAEVPFTACPDGGDWKTWCEVSVPVELRRHRNRVKLEAIGSSGPNLDSMTITEAFDPQYNFGLAGEGDSCPGGADVSEDECLAAAQGLLASGQEQGRTHLVAGSWGWVPPGCSVQTHRTHGREGDFAAHYNRGNGANDGGYTKVCALPCQHHIDADVVAGTFEHYGRDGGGAQSDEECSARCQADAECTAWVRQPSTGNCWISRQAVVTFERDTDRVTGLRCDGEGEPSDTVPIIQNPDFETGFTTNNYEYTRDISGWTAAGGTVAVRTRNGPWGGIAASSGNYLLALQSRGASVKQDVSGFMVGRQYRLKVYAAQRTNSPGGRNARLRVAVNGDDRMNSVIASTSMAAQEMTFTADSSTMEIMLENTVDSGDQTVFIDAIELTEA